MKIQEIEKLEKKLEKKGYRKFTQCLSSQEDWGWFKTLKDEENYEKVTIEVRFWDFRKYRYVSGKEEGIGLDILFLCDDGVNRMDNVLTGLGDSYYKNIDIDEMEGMAMEYFEYCKKISEKVKKYGK